VTFLTSAMDPARYVRDPAAFDALRQDLSEVLSLGGLKDQRQGQSRLRSTGPHPR